MKIGLFKIVEKISEVIYRLNLPAKMKIYSVQHIIILEPAYRNLALPVYKEDIYRGQKEDK